MVKVMSVNSAEIGFQGFHVPSGRHHPSRLSRILRQFDRSLPLESGTREGGRGSASSTEIRPEPGSRIRVPVNDRRRFLRRKSYGTARVAIRTDANIAADKLSAVLQSAPFCGRICDLSMSGVSFFLGEPLREPKPIWVRLESDCRDFAVCRSARVVRIENSGANEWKIVCRFEDVLPKDDASYLGHELC